MGGVSKRALQIGAAAALAALTGCGSSGYAPTNLRTEQPVASSRAGGETAPSGRPAAVVTIRGVAFNPPTIRVHAGQTVEWINRDAVLHNVTAANGHTIVSPNLGRGQRFYFTARAAGTIAYYCTIHASAMRARVIVEP